MGTLLPVVFAFPKIGPVNERRLHDYDLSLAP